MATGRLVKVDRRPSLPFCMGAAMGLALATILSGCTRSDGYVVFSNHCDEEIVVSGIEGYEPEVVPAGGAADFLSRQRPNVTLDLPDGRKASVDFGAWVDKYTDAPDGDVVVEQSVCDGLGDDPAFTNQTSRYLEETYGELLTD